MSATLFDDLPGEDAASAVPLYDAGGRPLGPKGRAFTDEQAAAVRRREGALLLSANAGSGKTSVLVERLVRLAVEDGVELTSVLAITFTEKAAGEMRGRLRARLTELGRRDLVAAAEAAWISTIHGFCARVLRAHAVAAGLDPGFRVLDEREARRVEEEAFERALAAFLNGDDAAHRAAALDLVAAYTPDQLQDVVTELHERLRSRGMTHPSLPVPGGGASGGTSPAAAPAAALPEPDLAGLRAATATVVAHLAASGDGKRVTKVRGDCEALAAALDALPDGAEPPASVLAAAAFKAGNAKALQADPCVAFLEVLERASAAWRDRRALVALGLVDELLRGFGRELAATKRASSAVDFADLELLTRDLLRDRPAIAAAYRERFVRVMVDEFQDTNPLQLELLSIVAPEPFEVGDEHQSIYGFRNADVEVFRGRRTTRQAQDAAMTLATNFRSHPELLETLNALFAERLGPAFAPLTPPGGRAPGGGTPAAETASAAATSPATASSTGVASATGAPRVELLLTHATGWDAEDAVPLAGGLPPSTPARHAEARLVARRVAELLGECRFAARDVVVLLRAMTDLTTYERALRDEGLPTLAAGVKGWWARRQVLDLCAYLATLANPRDEEALFALLASPLVGLSSDGLALVAAAAPRGRRWEVLQDRPPVLPAADAAKLAGFAAWFAAERAGAPRRGLDDLLARAVADRGYDLHVLGLPDGRRRLANVLKLQRLAAGVEARRGRDVRAFIDIARAELEAGARENDAPVELGDQDAVRLMSVHAAKGLEFPCVVLADLGRRSPLASPVVTVGDDDGRVGLKLVTLDGHRADALDHGDLVAARRAREREESDRVLYVGMTRAEELLVLAGVADLDDLPDPGKEDAPPVGWVAAGLVAGLPGVLAAEEPVQEAGRAAPGGFTSRVRVVRSTPADAAALGLRVPAPDGPPQLEIPGMDRGDGGPDVLPPLPAPPTAGVATLSYSSLSAYSRCSYRWYLERVLRLPRDDRDRELAKRLRAEEEAAQAAQAATGEAPDTAAAGEAPDTAATGEAPGTAATGEAPGTAAAPPPSLALPAGGYDALARGSLVHGLLEDLDLARPEAPTGAAIRERAAQDLEVELDDEDVADVVALLDAFLASPLRTRLAQAPWSRRELGFSFALGAGEPLVTGVLDVVAREADGGMLVVDYKTDAVAPDADLEAHVAASYGIQRHIYALACLRTGAPHVEVAHLYLARPDAPAVARYAAQDADALAAAIRAPAADLLAGRFVPTDAPHRALCLTCPGRRGLCSQPEERTLQAHPAPASPAAAG